ncbi:MAG: tRNA guanosine(34) transglycosylase Tgt [Gemmatimonadetes bacterium]|nr:tRNA guanosine(34) transglycosylase Tgt [Gemmatimonadota bacterium]
MHATSGAARAGSWSLPHGVVETPCFMPVGTQGTVRALSPKDLEAVGATLVLANTYHLHLRPGEDTVARLGGLHRFMGWRGPLLTDSGGFQVFSLAGLRRVTEEGVEFHSHIDGSARFLTPERVVEIQWALGPDVAMALDHVVAGEASREQAADALARTARWLERASARFAELVPDAPARQVLVPIIQGGIYPDLRRTALDGILSSGDWRGIAVGGLSVGEPKAATHAVLDDLVPVLPAKLPRYLMGVGFPEDVVAAISRGMDLGDCVAPTRMGRNGTAFTDDGPVNMRNARYREDDAPLDRSCDCETCTGFPRGYLRHLFAVEELLGLRLLSLHNVRYLIRLAARARAAILDRTFEGWSRAWLARYTSRERA